MSHNNTFFNSRDNLEGSDDNNRKRKDSNNSRNSMVDLEFNNSIPSER